MVIVTLKGVTLIITRLEIFKVMYCWMENLWIKRIASNITADISCWMVRLTVHPEAALLHSTQLLQLLVHDVHGLLHALPLCHGHLAHTAGRTNTTLREKTRALTERAWETKSLLRKISYVHVMLSEMVSQSIVWMEVTEAALQSANICAMVKAKDNCTLRK